MTKGAGDRCSCSSRTAPSSTRPGQRPAREPGRSAVIVLPAQEVIVMTANRRSCAAGWVGEGVAQQVIHEVPAHLVAPRAGETGGAPGSAPSGPLGLGGPPVRVPG